VLLRKKGKTRWSKGPVAGKFLPATTLITTLAMEGTIITITSTLLVFL
jgi:hypothetical protein